MKVDRCLRVLIIEVSIPLFFRRPTIPTVPTRLIWAFPGPFMYLEVLVQVALALERTFAACASIGASVGSLTDLIYFHCRRYNCIA